MASLPKTIQIAGIWQLIAATLCATPAWSQQLAATVQLPTFSSFSVNTSVSVPDSGGPYRDLVRRSRSGQTRPYSPLNPLLLNPLSSITNSATDSTVAREHGFSTDEIGPAGNLVMRRESTETSVGDSSNSVSRKLADVRRNRQRESIERDQAVRQSIANGREAAARGRLGSARIFFETAARKATGTLRDEALAELQAIGALPKQVAERPGKATE